MADEQTPQQTGDSGVVTPPPAPQAPPPGPGDPTPKPQAPDSSAPISNDEYERRLRNAFQYGDHPDGQKLANDPNPPHPTRNWFQRNFLDPSASDMLHSEYNAVGTGLNEGFRRVAQGLSTLTGRDLVSGNPLVMSPEQEKQVYGTHADDAVANGIREVTSWLPTILLTKGLGGGTMAEAGAVGFTQPLDDAKQVAGKTPALGWMRLLISNPNDPQIIQRAENMARGWVSAKVFQAGLAGIKLAYNFGKNLLSPEEVQAATETVSKYVNHEPVTEQDHLVPKPQADGTYTLEKNPESPVQQNPAPEPAPEPTLKQPLAANGGRPSTGVQNFNNAVDAHFGVSPGEDLVLKDKDGTPLVRVALSNRGGDVVELKSIENLSPANRSGNPTRVMQDLTRMADEHGVTISLQASPFGEKALAREDLRNFYRKFGFEQTKAGEANMVRRPLEADNGFRETAIEKSPEPPVFADRAEAEAQAASMNTRLDAAHASGPVSAEDATAFGEKFTTAMTAPSPENVENAAEHFNLNYFNEDKETLATLDATAQQIHEQMVAAQKRGTPVAETIRDMAKYLGSDLSDDTAARVGDDLQQSTAGLSAKLLAGDFMLKKAGNDIGQAGLALSTRLHDPILVDNMRAMLGKYFLLAQQVAGANSEMGRGLNILRYRDAARLAVQSGDVNASIEAARMAEGAGVPGAGQMINVQKMSPQQIAAIARMFQYSEGAPRFAAATTQAAKIMGEGEQHIRGALEYFVNNLLSHPKILVVKLASDFSNNLLANTSKILAGAGTLNRPLAQEGIDGMVGNFKYLEENLRGAAATLRSGQSVYGVRPPSNIIGGVTGDIVRTPSRAIAAVDEFAKGTNYRAWVRAQSLRIGREQGLDGPALERRVQQDLLAAYDPNTGEAVVPNGIKFAEANTFQTPLDPNTVMGGFHNYVQNHIEAKFIAPFTKISTNIFENVWQTTPGLNLFNARARAIFQAGGEDAAVLHTRSLMAGAFYGWAYYMALQGKLTGQGPTDPHLKQQWNQYNKPYTITLPDGSRIAYKRLEPVGSYLGLIADLHDIHASWNYDRDPKNAGYAVVGAVTANLASKTYMTGITNFVDAFAGKGDPNSVRRYINGFASSALVPGIASDLNPDPHYREVSSLLDAIKSRTPGLSQTLPPNYNLYGEPVMKVGGEVQRALNPFPWDMKDDGEPLTDGKTLSEKLLETEKAIGPLATTMLGKHIDLLSHDYDAGADPSVKGKTPWQRWNELINKPEDGDNLREALTNFVKDGNFDELSKGTHEYPGGAAQKQVNKIVNAHRNAALKQLREEFPALDSAIRYQQARRAAAASAGAEGVQQVQADSADFGS